MYKLINNRDGSPASVIFHIESTMWIPFDEANTDYQNYLKWLEAGNQPQPAEEPK